MYPDKSLKGMFPFWGEVFDTLEQAIGRLDETSADHRCSDNTRSIREILVHVVDIFNRDIVEFVLGSRPERSNPRKLDGILKMIRGQKRLLEDLLVHHTMDFMSETKEFMGSPRSYGDALWNVLTEQLHHRGQVFILMSSEGVKPPEI